MRAICAVAVAFAVGALVLGAWSAPAGAVAFPGPDNFGYKAKDQNTPGGPAFVWDSIIGKPGTVTWSPFDDQMIAVSLPFAYPFYNNVYTTVRLSDNGFLTFNPYNSFSAQKIPVGGSFSPNNLVAAYWSDIKPSCGGTYAYQVSGPVGDRVFTVEYNGVKDWSTCSKSVTAQAKLFEATGCARTIILQADGNMGGYASTVGIENALGNDALLYSWAQPAAPLSNVVVEYCTPPPSILTVGADTLTVMEDTVAFTDIQVLQNDADSAGSPIDIVAVADPPKGIASIGGSYPNEYIRYRPDANQFTNPGVPDTFTYTAKSTTSNAKLGTITVDITPVNDKPSFFVPFSLSVLEDKGPTTLNAVTFSSMGPFESAQLPTYSLTATMVIPADLFATGPTIDASTGKVSFTTTKDRCGSAQLGIGLKDSGGTANGGIDTANPANIPLTVTCVDDPPVAVADADYPLVVPGSGPAPMKLLALANDFDPDQGDAITIQGVTPATFGTAAVSDAGQTLTFTPPAEWTGEATMAYTIRDKTLKTASAKVTVDLACQGVRAYDDHYSMEEDGTLAVAAALGLRSNDDGAAATRLEVVRPPSIGTVAVAADGSFTYTPRPDAAGTDTWSYRLRDAAWCQDEAVVHVDVLEMPDAPGDAGDRFTVLEDSADNELYVLGNDPVGAKIQGLSAPHGGQARLRADRILYTPAPDFHGTDRFEYFLLQGAFVRPVPVEVTVLNTPDDPLGRGDEYRLAAGRASSVEVLYGVLRNDRSPDGHALAAELVAPAAHGRLDLRRDGSFAYTPEPGFLGSDGFVYRPVDQAGHGGPVQVRLDVQTLGEPVAALRAEPADPTAGIPVRFEDLSRGDMPVTHWQWHFGDGNTSSDRLPIHTYAKPGRYTVLLRVVDTQGNVAQATHELLVAEELPAELGGAWSGLPPAADAGADRTVDEGAFVQLDGTAGDGLTALAYAWRQDAGPAVDLQGADTGRPSFVAPAVPRGADRAELRFLLSIYDGHAESAPDAVVVTVLPRPVAVAADAGPDLTVREGDEVVLMGRHSGFRPGDEVRAGWRQLDGEAVDVAEGAVLRFVAPGPQTLRFAYAAEGASQSAVDNVTVLVVSAGAAAGFEPQADGLTVRLRALVPGEARWTLGDGAFSRDAAPEHAYARPGTYRVVLEVDRGHGIERYEQDVAVGAQPAGSPRDAPGAALAWSALAVGLAAARRRRDG